MQAVRYLGMNVKGEKPCITKDDLELCDERRDLKKRYEAEGDKECGLVKVEDSDGWMDDLQF